MRRSACLLWVTALAAILIQCSGVRAWSCDPHMIIAAIAQEKLESETRDRVQELVKTLSEQGPFPRATDMIQSACWPDDIKRHIRSMQGWHFANIPYNPTQYSPTEYYPQKENVVTVIDDLSNTVHQLKYHYGHPPAWDISFAVVNLIHFVGDIHQPLHVTELFSERFPRGDAGGNLFDVKVGDQYVSLHHLWDSACGALSESLRRPLSTADARTVMDLANELISKHPVSPSERSNINMTLIAEEGYASAVSNAYANLRPGDTLSPEYLSNCRNTAEKLVTRAGYRLATLLNALFRGRVKSGATLWQHNHHLVK